jgi:hypothetical protein
MPTLTGGNIGLVGYTNDADPNGNRRTSITIPPAVKVAAAVAAVPSTTALDAAMATLVADGASPTQAHVTAANSALTSFETALTAYNNSVAVAKAAAFAAVDAHLGVSGSANWTLVD